MTMESNRLVRDLNFRAEILPVLLIGIILDLFGRFGAAQLNLSYLFLDMAGTAMTAMLLGPWWAATVGIASNAISGTFFENYFFFGIVPVAAGVFWGYCSRALRFRQRFIDTDSWSWRHLSRTYAGLWLSGAVVCTLTSFLIKITLYPTMGRPLIYGEAYQATFDILITNGLAFAPTITALLMVDLGRELLDKAIVLGIGMTFAIGFGFAATAVDTRSLRERLKTDWISLVAFACVYGFYLLIARIVHPRAFLTGATHAIDWLKLPSMIVLFYGPLFISLGVFLIGTLDLTSRYGVLVERCRRMRLAHYRGGLTPFSFQASAIESQGLYKVLANSSVYGLIATIAAWPLGKSINAVLVVSLYFALAFMFVAIFFYENRARRRRLALAHGWGERIYEWMDHTEGNISSSEMIRLMAVVFKNQFLTLTRPSRCLFDFTFITSACPNRPALPSSSEMPPSFPLALLAVVNKRLPIESAALASLNRFARESGLREIYLLCTTPTFYQRDLAEEILSARKLGVKVVLLAWSDLENAVQKYVAEQDPATVLDHADLRTVDSAINAIRGGDTVPITADDLALRSLPTLRHFLSTQPSGTRVLDLGAGRGRHTLLALALGHKVTAIDRQRRALDDIAKSLSDAAYAHLPAPTLICADFITVPREEVLSAEIIICTGVLQHAQSISDLKQQLDWLRSAAGPWASIYLEMLFEMKFDNAPPQDGRLDLSQEEFERLLPSSFPVQRWKVRLAHGPSPRLQDLGPAPRSFFPTAAIASFTAVEYLLTAEA